MDKTIGTNVNRLKQAVDSVEVPPFLEARVRNRLQQAEPKRPWSLRLIPIAMAAGFMVSVGIAYQLGHLRLTAESQESYIISVSNQVATLMRVGLGDHIHCSVFSAKPKTQSTAEEFVKKLGKNYSGLLPLVQSKAPAGFKVSAAHQCSYNKRRFVHLSMTNGSKLMSLVIATKRDGESFETEGLLPALEESGLPIYQSGVQRFAMDAFESPHHLVYVISDMSPQENREMMVALAQPVSELLKGITM